MLGEAMGVLKATPPGERADLGRALVKQIAEHATGDPWKAAEWPAANGATAFLGDQHALVIDATGAVFKGPNGGLSLGVVDGKPGIVGWAGLKLNF